LIEKEEKEAEWVASLLFHDNAKSHFANSTCEKVLELGWTGLSHLPYSSDLAVTKYHLFRSRTNDLGEKK
jgi:hypothetical protein